jgi:hypothetical protein
MSEAYLANIKRGIESAIAATDMRRLMQFMAMAYELPFDDYCKVIPGDKIIDL